MWLTIKAVGLLSGCCYYLFAIICRKHTTASVHFADKPTIREDFADRNIYDSNKVAC